MALKQEDTDKILEYLDIQGAETFEDAKTKFDEIYARKEVFKNQLFKDPEFIDSVTGRRMGIIERRTKQFAKEFDIDVEADDIKNVKGAEELVEVILTKTKNKYKEEVDNFKKGHPEPSEALKELQAKADKYKSERDKFKSDVEKIGGEYEGYKQEVIVKEKNSLINSAKMDALSKVKFKADITEMEKLGFDAKIANTYKIDLNEEKKIIVTDKEGNLIPNPKKAGTYYELQELFEEEAIKAKIYQVNPEGGRPAFRSTTQSQPDLNQPPEKLINPRAMA